MLVRIGGKGNSWGGWHRGGPVTTQNHDHGPCSAYSKDRTYPGCHSWSSLETDHCPVCSPRGAPSVAGNQIVKMCDMAQAQVCGIEFGD